MTPQLRTSLGFSYNSSLTLKLKLRWHIKIYIWYSTPNNSHGSTKVGLKHQYCNMLRRGIPQEPSRSLRVPCHLSVLLPGALKYRWCYVGKWPRTRYLEQDIIDGPWMLPYIKCILKLVPSWFTLYAPCGTGNTQFSIFWLQTLRVQVSQEYL